MVFVQNSDTRKEDMTHRVQRTTLFHSPPHRPPKRNICGGSSVRDKLVSVKLFKANARTVMTQPQFHLTSYDQAVRSQGVGRSSDWIRYVRAGGPLTMHLCKALGRNCFAEEQESSNTYVRESQMQRQGLCLECWQYLVRRSRALRGPISWCQFPRPCMVPKCARYPNLLL